MAEEQSQNAAGAPATTAQVVCFGMITPAVVITVNGLPDHNTGTLINGSAEFISDDAAIAACLLKSWGIRSGLIGTALGNDPSGRRVVRQLKKLGILGRFRLSGRIATPFEVNISDATGARTYFWQRDAEVLDTLDTADLSLLAGARFLYVDWYDGDHILRPILEAERLGVPVFLNIEHGHQNPEVLSRYAPHATVCQAITNPDQKGGDPLKVANKLLEAGVKTAVVTLAGEGCVVASGSDAMRVVAPTVPVVDGCGAGATFSAGMLYGQVMGWQLEANVRFATAAASLKCGVLGPQAFPLSEINILAAKIEVQQVAIG